MMTQLGPIKSTKIYKGNTEISKIFYREKQVWANSIPGPVGPGGRINPEFFNTYMANGAGLLFQYVWADSSYNRKSGNNPLTITQLEDRARIQRTLTYTEITTGGGNKTTIYAQIGLNTFLSYATNELNAFIAEKGYTKVRFKADISITRPTTGTDYYYDHVSETGSIDTTQGKVWSIDGTFNISDVITVGNPGPPSSGFVSTPYNQCYKLRFSGSTFPSAFRNVATIDIYELTFLE